MKEMFDVGFDNEDMINFIQDKGEYYTTKFKRMKESQKPFSWNWPAFLFSFLWCLYRKMYGVALGIFVLDGLLSYCSKSSLIPWIVSIAFGVFANYLYLNHCNNKLSAIVNLDSNKKESKLLKQGGVSLGALTLGIIFIVAMFCISVINRVMF